jgi:hypothetical protein
MIWGLMNVVLIRMSEMDEYKIFNSGSLTVGITYFFIAFGCFLGPIISQNISGSSPLALRCWLYFGVLIQFTGMLFAGWAPNIYVLLILGCTFRCSGESLIYVNFFINSR